MGLYYGLLGRYEPADRLLSEAGAMARDGSSPKLQGDVYLSRGFIFLRQRDCGSSDHMFRSALNNSEQMGGWYFRGHALGESARIC